MSFKKITMGQGARRRTGIGHAGQVEARLAARVRVRNSHQIRQPVQLKLGAKKIKVVNK